MNSENVSGENSVDSVHSVEKPLPNSRKLASFVIPSEVEGSLTISIRV